jgi:hypothetical protein
MCDDHTTICCGMSSDYTTCSIDGTTFRVASDTDPSFRTVRMGRNNGAAFVADRVTYAGRMRVLRWTALLLAVVLLVQVGWWMILATSLPSTLAYGLAHCQANSSPFFIGGECGSDLVPAFPIGLSILVNLLLAGGLVAMFAFLSRRPDSSEGSEQPA